MALSLTPNLLHLALKLALVCMSFISINNHSMRDTEVFPLYNWLVMMDIIVSYI